MFFELKDSSNSVESSRSVRPRSNRDNHSSERRDFKHDTRSESRRVKHRRINDHEERYHGREARGRYEREYSGDYGRKWKIYDGSGRTPGT